MNLPKPEDSMVMTMTNNLHVHTEDKMMKKLKKFISRIRELENWAALLMAGAAFTACSSSSEDSINEPPANPTEKTYTMTIQATKGGDAMTRALQEGTDANNNTIIKATWTAGDEVSVTKESGGATQATYGTLTATNVSDDGLSCTLTGKLTGTLSKDEELTLRYHNGGYLSQKGTLDYIAENCDNAIATVTVASVEDGKITTNGDANFESQQAIVKFSLKQPDGLTSVAAEYFTVTYGNKTYKVEPANALSDIYVAIPGNTSKVTLTAFSTTGKYTYEKSGVTFQNSKYYTISVKMKEAEVQDLWMLNGDYEASDGEMLTGTLSGSYKVSIKANATVFLKDVNINGPDEEIYKWAGITCIGSATIILVGTNTVKGFQKSYPGIYVPQSCKLTIKGCGSLDASSNGDASGIGGGNNINCGKIVIEGGTVTATGGSRSSGIGSAQNSECGDITITGGTVTAEGGEYAAGIGSAQNSGCGDITITGGTVTAEGGEYAAGIGSGGKLDETASCGNITINGGTVTAEGGEYAAGIGTGYKGNCHKITITNKVTRVTAIRGVGDNIRCIGFGLEGKCKEVKIGDVSYGVSGVGHNQDEDKTYIYQP